jgi:hypothetical protein
MIFCLEVLTGAYMKIQWYSGANDKNSSHLNETLFYEQLFTTMTCGDYMVFQT